MTVGDVMTRGVEVAAPDTTLQQAALTMRSLDIGPLPVCDGKRLVGMVTDRDITVRATAAGRDPRSTMVSEVMTPISIYCFAEQDIRHAAWLMSQYQIRRLPVLDQSKRLVGIVSLGDLAVRDNDRADKGLDEVVLVHVSSPPQPDSPAGTLGAS